MPQPLEYLLNTVKCDAIGAYVQALQWSAIDLDRKTKWFSAIILDFIVVKVQFIQGLVLVDSFW